MVNDFDQKFLVSFQKLLSTPSLDWFFPAITDLHLKSWFLLFIVVPALGLWIWKEQKIALLKVVALILILASVDGLCGQIIKKSFARPRPFESLSTVIQKSPAAGYSFVSNHAANTFAIAVFFSLLYPRSRPWWFILAFLVSLSRLYNGVHYLSDIIGGALIGSLMSYVMVRFVFQRLLLQAKGGVP